MNILDNLPEISIIQRQAILDNWKRRLSYEISNPLSCYSEKSMLEANAFLDIEFSKLSLLKKAAAKLEFSFKKASTSSSKS